MWKFFNAIGNTVWVVPRSTLWTWLYTLSDATQTALYWVLDPVEWIGKTASSIKEAVNNAFTNWKWYQKLWKAPASLLATPFMAVEWAAETLRGTWCNLFRNVRDTIANPFLNRWHWIKKMWSSDWIGEFKFEKINNKSEVSPRNRLASLFK